MIAKHPVVVLAAALAVLPFACRAIGFTEAIATEIALFAMVGLGFNLLLGYTGLLSFGHGLFFGFAAYAAALAQIHWFKHGFFAPIVFAVGATALLGVAVGFLALRRRGVYFSLLTLAFTALGFTIAFRWTDLTGGESGLRGVRRVALLNIELDNQLVYYYLCAVIVVVVARLLWRLVQSPFGAVLVAIRENEQRAAFLGYPVRRYKLAAFTLSAAVTALGGALHTFLSLFASADPLHPTFSGEILAMSIVGGSSHFLGPPLGAAFYILFREVLSGYTASWLFWFGLLFMAFILFSPKGLIGLGERVTAPFRKRGEELAAMASRLKPDPAADWVPGQTRARDARDGVFIAENVTKKFGDFVAVDDVTIRIEHGRLQALIGPNGAGKTTLFNVLSGLYPPERGRLTFAGEELRGEAADRFAARGIARSFQVTNLFQGLSVFENIRLGVQARHPDRFHMFHAKEEFEDINLETKELIRFLGLQGVEAAPVSSLSYGGQRLMEIGVALTARPRLLLLDEPLAGLAAAERERIVAMIRTLARHMGVLLVEHDIDRVFGFAERITAMANGRVLVEGTANEVRADRQVQEVYLGTGRKLGPGLRRGDEKDAGPAILALDKINTYYGKSHILHDVSLEVREGQVTALLGRNGAGKSSTIKSIMGLVAPASGRVTFAGEDIAGRTPERIARAGIGLVPQGRRLFPGLTVAENLRLGALARTGGGGVHWDAERIFGYFPKLRDKFDVKADLLSGGEQQMVAIARALSGNVKLLLLDEPFEGLAPAVVEEVFKALDQLRRAIAILIIEHDLDLVLALSDYAYVLDRGHVSHAGPAAPLLTDLDFRRKVLWV